jgi:hypothetical protein
MQKTSIAKLYFMEKIHFPMQNITSIEYQDFTLIGYK